MIQYIRKYTSLTIPININNYHNFSLILVSIYINNDNIFSELLYSYNVILTDYTIDVILFGNYIKIYNIMLKYLYENNKLNEITEYRINILILNNEYKKIMLLIDTLSLNIELYYNTLLYIYHNCTHFDDPDIKDWTSIFVLLIDNDSDSESI
jgi:hypothetical protein